MGLPAKRYIAPIKCVIMGYYHGIYCPLPFIKGTLSTKEAGSIEHIYLTNEVAKILNVSIATVRNYAKSLERAGYVFTMKKQARLWTDKEINLIKEVQQFYANNDYTLEQCFLYVVTRYIEGEDSAKDTLEQLTPQQVTSSQTAPNSVYLEGIQKDTQALIRMLSDLKESVPDKSTLLQHQTETESREVGDLKEERDELLERIAHLENEVQEQQKKLDHVKSLNIFQFRKWKQEQHNK